MDSRIVTRLRALRARLRSLIAFDGATWIVGTFLAVLLPTVGLDWWLHLPGPARLVLLAGALGGTAYAAWRFFIAPLRIPLAEDDMALAVEQRYPELGDRLITSVQLAHTPPGLRTETAISRELVAAIDRETENLVRCANSRPRHVSTLILIAYSRDRGLFSASSITPSTSPPARSSMTM